MQLRDPEYLLLLLVLFPMIWIYIRREIRVRPAVLFSDLSVLRTLQPSAFVHLRHVVFALRLLGIGLLCVALARPRAGRTEEEVSTEGVDIVLALDVSTSMKALDFKPHNRLFVARETIKEFINKRRHDRIGMVVFAGRSYTKCPLTLDYNILARFIDEIRFGEIEDGTAIGTAIATGTNRILRTPAKSKVIVLLTDGANNRGDIAPLTAAQAAAELGIRIYTVGIGREGKVPYPFEVRNRWTGKVTTEVQMVDSDFEEETLKAIADRTGGLYFRARSADNLKEIFDKIDKLEKTEIKTMSYTTWSEHFFMWLLAGVGLLLFELVLSNTVFRRIP